MRNNSKRPLLILLATFALLAAGFLHLFHLRFEAGDIYPPYSSLRSDPLGTRALHDSLQKLDARQAGRNYRSADKLRDVRDVTLIRAGIALGQFSSPDHRLFPDDLASFVAQGGRLVVAFAPENSKPPQWDKWKKDDKKKKEKSKTDDSETEANEDENKKPEEKQSGGFG